MEERRTTSLTPQDSEFIDVISPCVAFNNHAGSTMSYEYIRDHNEAVNRLDFWPNREAINIDYSDGSVIEVSQHDGTILKLRKTMPSQSTSVVRMDGYIHPRE